MPGNAIQSASSAGPFSYAYGVVNPFHAGGIVAQSKALCKWSCVPSDQPMIHAACLQLPYLFSITLRLQCITSECI